MKKFDFFFDTADAAYIEEKWSRYSRHVDPGRVLGVTTNPSAFAKEGLNTLEQWMTRTKELCSLVSKIKGGHGGMVHVQMPSDHLTPSELKDWITEVSGWSDGVTEIYLKIPPYKKYLMEIESIHEAGLGANVTGIADSLTVLSCALHGADFVSIIPGRMEESGIDAKTHVKAAMHAHMPYSAWELITGSMRTLEGLQWCAEYGTVPTIGKRVFDLITPELEEEVFGWSCDDDSLYSKGFQHPAIGQTQETIKLSENFFDQMNNFGQPVADEFTKK